jgi:hypothetical protein
VSWASLDEWTEPKEQEAVMAQGFAGSDRMPDLRGRSWQCCSYGRRERADQGSIPSRSGDGHDEADRSIEPLCHRGSLALSRAQLGLEIEQAALNLDVKHLACPDEEEVGSARISRRDSNFQPAMPRGMRLGDDSLSCSELTAVTKAH